MTTSLNTPTVVVSDKRIADLLCEAFEGGSNYWIESINPKPTKPVYRPWGTDYTPSYISAPFAGHVLVKVSDEGGDSMGGKTYRLDRASMTKGLSTFARECPIQFGELLSENDDATTGDCFLQCCLFGKVVFG